MKTSLRKISWKKSPGKTRDRQRAGFRRPGILGSGLGPGEKIEILGYRAGSRIGLWVPRSRENPVFFKLNLFLGKSRKILTKYFLTRFILIFCQPGVNPIEKDCIKIDITYFTNLKNTKFLARLYCRKIPGQGRVRKPRVSKSRAGKPGPVPISW